MSGKPSYEELEKQVEALEDAERNLREMEGLLRDEIERWRLLFEQSRDGIVILDQNGKVFAANKRYADILGYTVEEMHRLHVWDWDTVYSREQLIQMIQEVDASGAHFETQQRRKDGTIIDIELSNNGAVYRGQKLAFCICRDITERKRAENERAELITDLQKALAEIDTLRGILPICSYCKKIRNDKGYWEQIEVYLKEHSRAEFSHGLCPECAKKFYPDFFGEEESDDGC